MLENPGQGHQGPLVGVTAFPGQKQNWPEHSAIDVFGPTRTCTTTRAAGYNMAR